MAKEKTQTNAQVRALSEIAVLLAFLGNAGEFAQVLFVLIVLALILRPALARRK